MSCVRNIVCTNCRAPFSNICSFNKRVWCTPNTDHLHTKGYKCTHEYLFVQDYSHVHSWVSVCSGLFARALTGGHFYLCVDVFCGAHKCVSAVVGPLLLQSVQRPPPHLQPLWNDPRLRSQVLATQSRNTPSEHRTVKLPHFGKLFGKFECIVGR